MKRDRWTYRNKVFVGGSTFHNCYMLHMGFDQFLWGKLAGALKLIVLFKIFSPNFAKLTLNVAFSLLVFSKNVTISTLFPHLTYNLNIVTILGKYMSIMFRSYGSILHFWPKI